MAGHIASRFRIRIWAAILTMLSLASMGYAQDAYPEAGFGINFNGRDIFGDLNFGASIQQINASAKVSFQPRFGSRKILQESGTPNLLYQYQERRYNVGVEFDKRFKLSEISESGQVGLFVGAFGGVAFADYAGTDSKAGTKFAYQGMAGAYVSNPNMVILRAGYQYVPLPTQGISPHRVGISISIVLSDDY